MKKLSARQILAFNIRQLMQRNLALNTQVKLGKASALGQTTISYMRNPPADDGKKTSTKLDSVEKLAVAFGLQTWQMLIHPDLVGEQLYDLLMRPVFPDDKLSASWKAPAVANEDELVTESAGPRSAREPRQHYERTGRQAAQNRRKKQPQAKK